MGNPVSPTQPGVPPSDCCWCYPNWEDCQGIGWDPEDVPDCPFCVTSIGHCPETWENKCDMPCDPHLAPTCFYVLVKEKRTGIPGTYECLYKHFTDNCPL